MEKVEDVLLGWEQMAGKTTVHKQINAILTAIHIGRKDMSSDECGDEAGVVLGMQGLVEAGEWDLRVLWFLKERFATATKTEEDGTRKKVHLPENETACEVSLKLIEYVIEHYGPVPEHTLVDLVEGAMRRIARAR